MDKALGGLLGLAMRAGALCHGASTCENAIRCGKAHLAIWNGSLSSRTQRQLKCACDNKNIPYAVLCEERALGESIGRVGAMCVAVVKEAFVGRILQELSTLRESGDVEGEGLCLK